jgi:hypothetical protein
LTACVCANELGHFSIQRSFDLEAVDHNLSSKPLAIMKQQFHGLLERLPIRARCAGADQE